MRDLITTKRYLRDLKRMERRGANRAKLLAILEALLTDQPLPPAARPHKLVGQANEVWDAHIEPDWILLYEIDDDTLVLRRTGTHADLF